MHPIRNIILVTLLGIVSSNAYCAWEKIAGKGNEGLYVNLRNSVLRVRHTDYGNSQMYGINKKYFQESIWSSLIAETKETDGS